jgi:hypothetical protein
MHDFILVITTNNPPLVSFAEAQTRPQYPLKRASVFAISSLENATVAWKHSCPFGGCEVVNATTFMLRANTGIINVGSPKHQKGKRVTFESSGAKCLGFTVVG